MSDTRHAPTVILCCGGTGGHLAPGIAVAERLLEAGARCILVTSQKRVDTRMIQAYPNLSAVTAPAVSAGRGGWLGFLRGQYQTLGFARNLIRDNRANAVLAFGGFLSAGFLIAGRLAGIPSWIHEGNMIPGKVTRFVGLLANRRYLPKGVELRRNDAVAGFPVREAIQRRDARQARLELGLPESGKVLVILGGSQGASALTDWAKQHCENLLEAGISLFCLCGPEAQPEKREHHNGAVARFEAFWDDMASLMSAADLAVSRAGAGTIAELQHIGLPAILVPYPFAADNHQTANAQAAAAEGGFVVLLQDAMPQLITEVKQLMSDAAKLAAWNEKLRQQRTTCWATHLANALIHETSPNETLRE